VKSVDVLASFVNITTGFVPCATWIQRLTELTNTCGLFKKRGLKVFFKGYFAMRRINKKRKRSAENGDF